MTRYMMGWLPTVQEAEQLLSDLQSLGLSESHVGIMMRQGKGSPFIGKDMPANAAKGAVTGGAIGGVGGGILAALGALAIPGLGPILAGGVVATVIAGIGGGALTGGQFAGMFPSFQQEDVERHLREGNVMVLVDPIGHEAEVGELFNRYKVVEGHEVELNDSAVRRIQSPQSQGAIAPDEPAQAQSEGLAHSKTYLAAHPEVAEHLYDE